MRAKVIVLAGPSGAGKSRLCHLLGLPFLNLDDFYKDGTDETVPRRPLGPGRQVQDWDHPRSWLREEAVATLARICREGSADVPVYDIARDGRVGHRTFDVGASQFFVAEGIFAQEVVPDCRERGILADAICVRNPRPVTFWRRLTRDLRERRKPPWVLLRRGLLLMRTQPAVVAHAVQQGCVPLSSRAAEARIRSLVDAAEQVSS